MASEARKWVVPGEFPSATAKTKGKHGCVAGEFPSTSVKGGEFPSATSAPWLHQCPSLLEKAMARVAKAEAMPERRTVRRRGGRAAARNAFYRSSEWKAVRSLVLERDGRVCRDCGNAGPSMNVDHIKPRSKYPALALDPSNLRPLCWPCNSRKAAREVAA